MSGSDRHSQARVHVVGGRFPIWLGALLILPAAFLFAVSLALVVGVGLIGALFLPLAWRRFERRPPGDPNCIELDPDDFSTIEERDRLPPP